MLNLVRIDHQFLNAWNWLLIEKQVLTWFFLNLDKNAIKCRHLLFLYRLNQFIDVTNILLLVANLTYNL
jgi:hypothetical protein